MRPALLCSLFWCALSPAASSQNVDTCRAIMDDARRLACYDHVFPRAPTKPATAVGDFGLSQQQLIASGRAERPPAVQDLSARVLDRNSNADGEFIVILDNGQVWTQSELDTLASPQAGEVVSIHRGLLGSFLLVTSRGVATRVRRLK